MLTEPHASEFSWGVQNKWLADSCNHLAKNADPESFVYENLDRHACSSKDGTNYYSASATILVDDKVTWEGKKDEDGHID